MKTSLVSPFAEVAAAALSKSITVKADRPQQLQSVTIYWRGRKMVLMQRPQRRLSALLCKMLRRSWQNLFGTLVRAVGVGAMAAALTAQAGVASSLPANTLPIPVSQNPVQSGAATITQAGNQMTVTQTSNKAIIDWQSFSIGSSAGVSFLQNNASSVALNRVIGNDPSIIMGSLTAHGKIFLINAAGILVGKTGKIDVAGFTASTLNISDADFLAGKMNFAADVGKTIGNVTNKGAIKSADGGSVYLIGANVKNDGIITSPGGEVLLAAGSSVQLADTSLPGVTINVGGIDGKVTNLGQIIASAGTIGIGAALIDNSGIINASSVEKQGGRIFLRASKQLTTDATSKINADGVTGGNVQLYSDQVANIDGDVSALGSAGNGGYVDTSGKTVLSVHYVPRVGPGGTWFIDPYDVTIGPSGNADSTLTIGSIAEEAITANGNNATISASTIDAALIIGTNVTIATGLTGSAGEQAGDITVNAAITKSSGNSTATLTLAAANNITLNSDITSNGASAGMNLVLNAGGNVAQTSGLIAVNSLSVTASTGITLNSGGNNVQSFDAHNGTSGDIVFTANTSAPTLSLGKLVNASTNGNITISNTGGSLAATDAITTNAGTVTLTSSNQITQTSGSTITATGLNTTAANGITLNSTTNVVSSISANNTVSGNVSFTNGGTGSLTLNGINNNSATGNITLIAQNAAVTNAGNITTSGGNLTVNSGSFTNSSMLFLGGGTASFSSDLYNTGCGTVAGTGTINLVGAGGVKKTLINDHLVQISSGSNTVGRLTIGGNYQQTSNGTLQAKIDRVGGTGALESDQLWVKGNVSLAGTLWINPMTEFPGAGQAGDKVAIVNYGGTWAGAFDAINGLPGNLFPNYLLPITGSGHDISLAYAPAGSNYFTGAKGLDWNTPGNWFSNAVPAGSSADVYVDTGSGNTVTHATAVNDAIQALTIASGGLDVSNGTVAASGIATVYGSLSASGTGVLTLNTDAMVYGSLSARGTSTLQLYGNTVINGSFATSDTAALSIGYSGVLSGSGTLGINGGNLTIDGSINTGGSDLTMNSSGNVILGSINTSNLTVNALGSIAQVSNPTGGLTVTGTMVATANTGIKLDNGNGTCGTNHVANFSASNNGTGDITLVNNNFHVGDSLVNINNKLVSIHNAGGNISVENTGGMTTVGLIDARAGSVHLFTHSPLTIGTGGISAGNGVTLAAGTSGSSSDVLTLNGVIQTVSGNLAFAGNSVLPNAAIYGPNAPVFSSPNSVVFGSNYVYATSPPSSVIPVNLPIVPPTVTNSIDQNVAHTTDNENNNNTETFFLVPTLMGTSTLTKTSTDQTIGGSDGEFGGSSAKDDTKAAPAKSNKPLPVCT